MRETCVANRRCKLTSVTSPLFSIDCYVPLFVWWHATSRERTPPVSGHFDKVPRVSAYGRFDCSLLRKWSGGKKDDFSWLRKMFISNSTGRRHRVILMIIIIMLMLINKNAVFDPHIRSRMFSKSNTDKAAHVGKLPHTFYQGCGDFEFLNSFYAFRGVAQSLDTNLRMVHPASRL